MKSFGLLALLPALTCAFLLPIPPLFVHELSNSSHDSHLSELSHTSHNDVDEVAFNETISDIKEICPVIEFAQTEFCGNTTSMTPTPHVHVPPQLCSLLSLLNNTLCQDETIEKEEKGEKHVNDNNKSNISEINEKDIEKIYEILFVEEIKNNNTNLNPKDLCPVFDLVDKTFCTSYDNKLNINPKELCPLLEFVEKELCA
jgi:hypothetical protein